MTRIDKMTVIFMLIISLLIFSCSDNREDDQKGAIDQMTDRAAEIAVEKIQTPIKEAEEARSLVENGMKMTDDLLEEE